jgi:hypothetical protein
MAKIFISYRWADSQDVTHRIHDHLLQHFGQNSIFMDIDTIPLGVDLRKHVESAVARCDVLLAVIGKQWLNVRFADGTKKGQRRLDDPGDLVRTEIQVALERDIPLIPVLVGGASMPGDGLPEVLKSLAFRSAAEVASGKDFKNHVSRLIEGIE